MPDWIRLDVDRLLDFGSERRTVHGVAIRMPPSPYNVPEAIRAINDPATGRRVIEFRYLGEEPWQRVESGRHVWLRVGKRTGRLYGIEIDVGEARRRGEVQTRIPLPKIIRAALQAWSEGTRDREQRNNFIIAKHALSEAKDVLSEPTPEAVTG